MGHVIKEFADGTMLEYDEGRFDGWCIYHVRPGESRKAIIDLEIFSDLDHLGQRIGSIQLYRDFLSVYQQTTATIEAVVLNLITELARKHLDNQNLCDFLLTALYAGMVAEENKDGAILRKRIKRLGVHQLLVEERPAAYAANFSRGKSWKEIVIECEVRGF